MYIFGGKSLSFTRIEMAFFWESGAKTYNWIMANRRKYYQLNMHLFWIIFPKTINIYKQFESEPNLQQSPLWTNQNNLFVGKTNRMKTLLRIIHLLRQMNLWVDFVIFCFLNQKFVFSSCIVYQWRSCFWAQQICILKCKWKWF